MPLNLDFPSAALQEVEHGRRCWESQKWVTAVTAVPRRFQ
jgi:hypothetical protein